MSWERWNGRRPLEWYRLMGEMERLREETGLGLAHTWDLVNQGRYDDAVADLERVRRQS